MGQRHGRGSSPALAPGTRIAERYVVVRVLGEGGMGQVFEVEHEALGRHFALKILNITPCTEEVLRRFRREARALGRVTTPRVAQVTDFGVDDRFGPYYVMELLDGETLEDRLERDHHIAVSEAIPLAIDLCEALDEVHGAGIIHRDLKPSNVGLTRAGPIRVKLLDFGLAAAVDGTALERITRSQEVVGSLPYMAPERFHNAPLTLSIDLYALGVVLYEMFTGELPFDGTTAAVLINQHLNQTPRPMAAVASGLQIPPSIEALILQLLDKDPGQRFSTAASVARALQSAQLDAHVPTLSDDANDPSVAMTMLAEDSVETSALVEGAPASPADSEASGPHRATPSSPAAGLIPTALVPEGTPNPDLASWPQPNPEPSHPIAPTVAQVDAVPRGGWASGPVPPAIYDPASTGGAAREGPSAVKVVTIVVAGAVGSVLAALLAFMLLWDGGEAPPAPRPAAQPAPAPSVSPPAALVPAPTGPVPAPTALVPAPTGPVVAPVPTPLAPPASSPPGPGSVLAGSAPPAPPVDAGASAPADSDGDAASPLTPPRPAPPVTKRPTPRPRRRPSRRPRPRPRPRWTGGIIEDL